MAKHRYVKDSFWTDPYVEKLSPDYKLVFLYLLTNPLSNISGVFEIRLKRIAYETGYDIEVIENILKKFSQDNKIIQVKDWIILVNHLKHQYLGSKTAEGINRIIEEVPEEVKNLFKKQSFSSENSDTYEVFCLKKDALGGYPIQGVSKLPYSQVKLSKVELSKNKYGEFQKVLLTEEEHEKLIGKIGEKNTNLLIMELDGYIQSLGKKGEMKYKDHYATIGNWARRKYIEQKEKSDIKKNNIAFK